jgi:hypothetical protein
MFALVSGVAQTNVAPAMVSPYVISAAHQPTSFVFMPGQGSAAVVQPQKYILAAPKG